MKKIIAIRLGIIFIIPLILVIVLNYYLFFVEGNIEIGKTNIENDIRPLIRPLISNALLRQEQHLEFLKQIIDPEWFLYSVRFYNNKKLAFVSNTAEPPYTEREVLFTLILNDKEIPIPYGDNETISYNIRREEILNKFRGYKASIVGNYGQEFGPGANIKIQDHPSLGAVHYKVALSSWSVSLIYLFVLIAWSGLFILAKPIFQFIYFGKQWWLKI